MKKDLFTLKVCLLTSALALWSIATTAQSRSSGSKSPAGAAYMFNDGSVATNAKGANAIFATDGATITISNVTIDNTQSVSRGLHCTGGGIINASNITTRSETSSTMAPSTRMATR